MNYIYRLTITRRGYYRNRVKYVRPRHLKLTLNANRGHDVKIERVSVGEFEDVTAEFASKP